MAPLMSSLSSDKLEFRRINGVWLLGPDLFSRDSDGKPLSPIASAFPRYGTVISGRGIHAMQAALMVEFARKLSADAGRTPSDAELAEGVYGDSVALLIRDPILLIRSNPGAMDRVFEADELVQRIVPKDRIQFTGIHLPEVRRRLRGNGEIWRFSPPPRSVAEIGEHIRSSRVRVGTGLNYYYNAPTGGRFLTYEEYTRIRPLIREDRDEALRMIREIIDLAQLVNNQGNRELSLFLPAGVTLSVAYLTRVAMILDEAPYPEQAKDAEELFDRFAFFFSRAAGPELTRDDEHCDGWRTSMFCRLYDLDEHCLEEFALGLSPEFHLNVRWLPGARIREGNLTFEVNTDHHTRNIIDYYWKNHGDIQYINVGRVELPLTDRDTSDEDREVHLAVIGRADGEEEIRLARLMKWSVMHRMGQDVSLDHAIRETVLYRDYIFDRLRAIRALGCPIVTYREIRFEEEVHGVGTIPVFFFERSYVPGIVSHRIPPRLYGLRGFILRLAHFLGTAAAMSLVLGRVDRKDGRLYFDDGDEVIQLGEDEMPEKLVIVETTGSFTDWASSLEMLLPDCLVRLAVHLGKALSQGRDKDETSAAVEAFAEALSEEVRRMRGLARDPSSTIRNLFADRSVEPGGIRSRWEGILNRLDSTDPDRIRILARDSRILAPFISDVRRPPPQASLRESPDN